MNLTHNRHHSKTCSCNSCVFKRDVIGYGSRIDKLYHNNYLPLRERKLLDKLVRTRSVYDDIRNRILSLSSVDIAKDRELEGQIRSESESDASAAQVRELVDLIDRGEHPSSVHLHSDCCGCCVCSSKSRIHKPYKVHMHIPEKEHIDRYVESHRYKMRKDEKKVGFKAARSDPCMCTLKFSKIPKKPKYVVKDHRSKNSVSDKLKKRAKKAPVNIKCECNIDGADETYSKKSIVLLKNAENRVRNSIRSTVTKIENVFHIKKDSLMIFRDQLKKKHEMKAWECDPDFCIPNECSPDECYEKVKRREANKMKLKANHFSDSRRYKVKQTQSPPMQKYESYHNKERPFPFPRECEPLMCIPGECDPRDCTKILLKSSPAGHELTRCFCTQQRAVKPQKPRIEKSKKKQKVKNKSRTTMTKKKSKIICKCEVTDEVKDSVLTQPNQNQPKRKQIRPVADISNSSPSEPRKQLVRIGSSFKFDIEFYKEKNFPEGSDNTSTVLDNVRHKVRSIKNNNEEYKERSVSEVIIKHKDEQKHVSAISKDPSVKAQASHDTFLKRCLCTLKLHKNPKQKPIPKRPKSKMTMTKKEKSEKIEQIICKCKKTNIDEQNSDIISTKSQASMTTISYILPRTSSAYNLLPYECEPLFCVPDKCDPLVCEKQIQMRNFKRPKTISKEINTEPKKTTRTITSKSATPYSEKIIHVPRRKKYKAQVEDKARLRKEPQADKSKSAPNAPRKQAVKISSSFRFDIEFYKDVTPPNDDKYYMKEEKLSTSSSKNSAKTEIIENPRYKKVSVDKCGCKPQKVQKTVSQTTEPVKECFCTLKLKKRPKQKVKKSISKKTMTIKNDKSVKACECTSTQSTQTKKVHPKVVKPSIAKVSVKSPIPQYGLLPYECEPNFCIPGQCDPFICYDRIKERNGKKIDKEPLLKRCLCTLRFHNDNNTKRNRTVIPLQNNLEVTSVKSIGTDTKKMKIHQNKGMLLPNEGEPEIYRKRTTLYQAKYANTEVPKLKSVYSETSYVSKEKPQFTTRKVAKVDNVYEKENLNIITADTPAKSRQSVKLSSEFNFYIEFRKNKSNKIDKIKPKIGVKLTKGKSTKGTRRKNSATQVQIKDGSIYPESKRESSSLKLHKKDYQHRNHLAAQTSPKYYNKPLEHQQIYFVTKTMSAQFLKETNVSPCVCKPCLCIATELKKL